MSRSINSDKSWNSTDEEFEDCDNSSNSNSINRRISGDDLPPGCITTHSVSSVIRPGCKMPRNDPLQFVKIQNNELSKKAVEQIKLAEEVKITKEKIKEVEEEWQNNLLNWKSKRRQSKSNSEDESGTSLASNRKTKTFSEILNEKAKSGHRIGYNLHKYIDGDFENENQLRFDFDNSYESNENDKNSDESYKSNDNMSEDSKQTNNNKNKKSGLGDVIVFDTSLLEEFSYNHKRQDSSEDSSDVNINSNSAEVINSEVKPAKSNSSGDKNQLILNNSNNNFEVNNKTPVVDGNNDNDNDNDNDNENDNENDDDSKSDKVKVEIKDWKQNQQRDNVLMYLLQQEQHQTQHQLNDEQVLSHHNSSYEVEEDEEEDDEELERLRLDQERSFKAKLSAFESLAKQEENTSFNNHNSINNNRLVNSSKTKTRDESKRPPPAVEELLHSEQQQLQQRPVYERPQYEDNDVDSEEVVNARIQQLHIERQRAQQKQQQNHNNNGQQLISQQQGVQQLPQQQVVYQSLNYLQTSQNQNPSQQLSQPVQQQQNQRHDQQQHQNQRHYDQQQYYLMDEPIVKQNQTPVRSPKQTRGGPVVSPPTQHKQQMPYQQPIQPQEHLYVNQKQLLMNQSSNHPQYYEQLESHERYGSPIREYYDTSYEKPQQIAETSAPQPQQIPKEASYSSTHNQYLYYPKPYANKSPQQVPNPIQKPVMISQQQKQTNTRTQQPVAIKQSKPQPPAPKPPQQQIGYNQNHWLLQEAELRRQLASIPTQSSIPSTVSATQRPTTSATSGHKSTSGPQKGMLSVSGKKKCSSCGDELGRGCAAMVVESLSLYYHINCFRCSVCNIQLGNGTVGTDVRVRNHKLHCQNCYSNDEAGLKFSRV